MTTAKSSDNNKNKNRKLSGWLEFRQLYLNMQMRHLYSGDVGENIIMHVNIVSFIKSLYKDLLVDKKTIWKSINIPMCIHKCKWRFCCRGGRKVGEWDFIVHDINCLSHYSPSLKVYLTMRSNMDILNILYFNKYCDVYAMYCH